MSNYALLSHHSSSPLSTHYLPSPLLVLMQVIRSEILTIPFHPQLSSSRSLFVIRVEFGHWTRRAHQKPSIAAQVQEHKFLQKP